jgi:hypothetical protein
LSELATTVLSDAGHNPSLDMVRRVTTTLEAMSAYSLLPDGLSAGRLTRDVDPPGFDSLAGFTSSPVATKPVVTQKKSPAVANKKREEDNRQEQIAAARAVLQDAKKSLTASRGKVQSLAASQKKIEVAAKEAEKRRSEIEKQLQKASATAADATRRVKQINNELKEATKALEKAEQSVKDSSGELEALFGQSPKK